MSTSRRTTRPTLAAPAALERLEARTLLSQQTLTVRGRVFVDGHGDGIDGRDRSLASQRITLMTDARQQTRWAVPEVLDETLRRKVTDVAIGPEGATYLLLRNSLAVLRSTPTGTFETVLERPQDATPDQWPLVNASRLLIRPDGRLVFLSVEAAPSAGLQRSANGLFEYDPATETLSTLREEVVGEIITDIALEPDGAILAVDRAGGTLTRFRDLATPPQVLTSSPLRGPRAVHVRGDGFADVLTGGNRPITRIDLRTGAQQRLGATRTLLRDPVAMTPSGSGGYLVVDGRTEQLVHLDLVTGRETVMTQRIGLADVVAIVPDRLPQATPGAVAIVGAGRLDNRSRLATIVPRRLFGSATTDHLGRYAITGQSDVRDRLRIEPAGGWLLSTPEVFAPGRRTQMTRHLGLFAAGSVTGVLFDDANRNGRRDAGEQPLPGVTVFADHNRNGALGGGEQAVVTDAAGRYTIAGLVPGTTVVRSRASGEGAESVWRNVRPGSGEEVRVDLPAVVGAMVSESGVVRVGHEPVQVRLADRYENPVVLLGPPTSQEGEPVVARVTAVEPGRFTVQLVEPPGENQRHRLERVSWTVVEAGLWRLPGGTILEAGTVTTDVVAQPDTRVGELTEASLRAPFTRRPLFVHTLQPTDRTPNEAASFLSSHVTAVEAGRFRVGLHPDRGSDDRTLPSQTVGYLAVQTAWPDREQIAGTVRNVGSVSAGRGPAVGLPPFFGPQPAVLASTTSRRETDPHALRMAFNRTAGGGSRVQFAVEEDRTTGNRRHDAERVDVLALPSGSRLQATAIRPNVLFLSFDDLNDWTAPLGGYSGIVHTPNLSRLAARGANFTEAWTIAPKCNPARTSVLTNLTPAETGILEIGPHWLDSVPDAVSMPAWFRQHGYATSGIGKSFHQLDPAVGDPFGFDHTVRVPSDVFDPNSPDYDPRGFGRVSAPERNFSDWNAATETVAALERHAASGSVQPFFLSTGFLAPHLPFVAPQEYFDLYPLEEIELPPAPPGDLLDVPAFARNVVSRGGQLQWLSEPDVLKRAVQSYLASITFMDAQLGRVLDALDASPHGRNTIVAAWSDHGMHFGEKQHFAKDSLWQESLRVPMTIAVPGMTTPGDRIDTPVSVLDLFATLSDAAGLGTPPQGEDRSLRPMLEGSHEYDGNAATQPRPVRASADIGEAVRLGPHVLIEYRDGSREFYDVAADPQQYDNLAEDPTHAALIADLARLL